MQNNKAIRYTEKDINYIISKAVMTGYDSSLDEDWISQNWHAKDDLAYSVINLIDLSQDAIDDILSPKIRSHLPINFDLSKIQIKFKWNEEWGDWSDVLYNGEKVWDFASKLPFDWLKEKRV